MLYAGGAAAAERAYGAEVCTRAADLRVGNAYDLCVKALEVDGKHVPSNRDAVIKAAFSTYSLTQALSNSAEKMMAEAFRQTPATWRSWCGRKPVANFKEAKAIRPYLKGGAFEEVGDGGELKYAGAQEDYYTMQADTYGRMFTVTRKTIVDDDLGVVMELAREIGRQGVRKISDVVYRLLLSNPSNFFHTSNSNYISGADTVMGFDGLEEAIQVFREQTDYEGNPIDVVPAVLVVPPAIEMTARALLNSAQLERSQATGDREATGNPLANLATLEVESRLDNANFTGGSSTAWYLFASPSVLPAFVVAVLNGVEFPTVESVELPSNVLGAGYRGYVDFGVSAADYRGGVKSAGA
jgi:hypothetical protein